jgi:Gram-negative bacterial TonB protein C-terminal
MNYKIGLLLLILFVFGAGNVFSQNNAPILRNNSLESADAYKVGEVRGSIKRKAVNLPKPTFPREALEAGADGIVKVEITIDAEGNVVSATAISGHPLLKNVSEETARNTKFKSSETSEPETGILTYNFTIEKASWIRIGFDLVVIQKDRTLKPFNFPSMAKSFGTDWASESEMLGKLSEMRRIEMEMRGDIRQNDRPTLVSKNTVTSNGSIQSSGTAQIVLPIPNEPIGDQIVLSQNLIAAIQSRLANDQTSLWKFNLGVNLMNILETARNPNMRNDAVIILRQFADNAPADISAESLTALKDLIIYFGKSVREAQKSDEVSRLLPILLRIK